jgi:hypothetical protein
MEEWDPLHVKHDPSARDEYGSFVGGVYGLLATQAGEEAIVDLLERIECVELRLVTTPREKLARVAQRLQKINVDL